MISHSHKVWNLIKSYKSILTEKIKTRVNKNLDTASYYYILSEYVFNLSYKTSNASYKYQLRK